MAKRALVVIAVFLCIIGAVFAQEIKKKPARVNPPVNSKQSAAADSTAVAKTTAVRIFLFPEFYHYWPIDKTDTFLKYECYDAHSRLINVDTLNNVDIIQHIYFVKTFNNYMRTHIDAEGKPGPSVVSKTLYRYDKREDNTWKSFDAVNSFSAELKEFKNDIVRTDTTDITDALTGDRQITIRKYYKVVEQNPKERAVNESE